MNDEGLDQPVSGGDTARMPSYAICSTQRSGTNFLCGLLESTGKLGRPTDYFNAASRRLKGYPDYPFEAPVQLEMIDKLAATPNGVLGFKVLIYDLARVEEAGWRNHFNDLKFIYLTRHDRVGQAISLVRAEQTQKWRSTDVSALAPVYDWAEIQHAIDRFAKWELDWERYFEFLQVMPLRLHYEELLDEPQGVLDAVGILLGVADDVPFNPEQIRIGVQRDALTEEWRARFLSSMPGLGAGIRASA